MPSQDKKNVLLRQWEMLNLIPMIGDGKSPSELTKELVDRGYKIDVRQVQRDVNTLAEVFNLKVTVINKAQFWKRAKGISFDMPCMTLPDALSLYLVEETLKKSLPASMYEVLEDRFRQAEKQLVEIGKLNHKAHWAKKIKTVLPTMPMLSPEINSGVLATVQEALIDDKQVELDYVTRDGRENTYRLNPLGIVNRGVVSYLIGCKLHETKPQLYALHRIRNATNTFEVAKRLENFDLDEYIDKGELNFGNGKEIKFSAWIDDNLAKTLNETPLSIDQKLIEGGEYVKLIATVPDTYQLTWWIMSQGDSLEVIAPVGLRRKIAGLLRDAADQYLDDGA